MNTVMPRAALTLAVHAWLRSSSRRRSAVSSWKVECSMSKSSDRHAHSASSVAAGSAPSARMTWAETHVHPRRDRPGVEVVAVDDARRIEDVPADVVHVDALRGRLEEHVGRVAQQRERAGQDEQGDERRGDGVGRRPAGQRDHDARRR